MPGTTGGFVTDAVPSLGSRHLAHRNSQPTARMYRTLLAAFAPALLVACSSTPDASSGGDETQVVTIDTDQHFETWHVSSGQTVYVADGVRIQVDGDVRLEGAVSGAPIPSSARPRPKRGSTFTLASNGVVWVDAPISGGRGPDGDVELPHAGDGGVVIVEAPLVVTLEGFLRGGDGGTGGPGGDGGDGGTVVVRTLYLFRHPESQGAGFDIICGDGGMGGQAPAGTDRPPAKSGRGGSLWANDVPDHLFAAWEVVDRSEEGQARFVDALMRAKEL